MAAVPYDLGIKKDLLFITSHRMIILLWSYPRIDNKNMFFIRLDGSIPKNPDHSGSSRIDN